MRVVMFGEQVFSRNWVDAARLVADVIHVRRVERSDAERRAEFRQVTDVRGLFRVVDDPNCYEFEARTDLPYRLLGRYADLPNARALVTALRFVQREHGSIDLLHGHFYSGSRDFPYLRRRLGVPYVVTEHSTALTGQSPDKSITRMGRRIARNVYANAAFVMPVSETLLAAIEDLGLPGRFVVVPNPVDVSRFSQAQPYVDGTFELVCVRRVRRG